MVITDTSFELRSRVHAFIINIPYGLHALLNTLSLLLAIPRWSIDQLAVLYPADIDITDKEVSKQEIYRTPDVEYEKKVIRRNFKLKSPRKLFRPWIEWGDRTLLLSLGRGCHRRVLQSKLHRAFSLGGSVRR